MIKKKIAILGSTGSIGRSSLEIFSNNVKTFKIILLSAKSNYSLIQKQINKYKPNYFVINDSIVFKRILKKYKKNRKIKHIQKNRKPQKHKKCFGTNFFYLLISVFYPF